MSWTRSAALRAGVTGAAGAALVLSVLPPISAPSVTSTSPEPTEAVFAMAAGELPIPTGPTAEEIAAADAARDRLAASRAQERAALAEREKKAERREARQKTKKREAKRASRTQQRAAVPSAAVIGERYTTAPLNVRTAPDGAFVTTLAVGSVVSITDRTDGGWRQIRYDGVDRWVSGEYLSTEKPVATSDPAATNPTAPTAPSGAACPYGSGIESGLGANARAVYRAVCARYPQVTSYGGYRPDGGNHGSGRAIDIMVSGQLGWDIANWVRANAGALGVSEVIYAQRIWTVQRGGEGWRGMSDRGSTTANHYDHVHVSTY
jgi:hypothetical protein